VRMSASSPAPAGSEPTGKASQARRRADGVGGGRRGTGYNISARQCWPIGCGMAKQRQPQGPPVTLGNIRQLGVQRNALTVRIAADLQIKAGQSGV